MSRASFVFAHYEGNNPGPIMDELFRNVNGVLEPNRTFQGATFSPRLDESRLTGQLKRVRDLMEDGNWRSLAEISAITGDPEASISARLRDLRRPAFGMYTVERRRRSPGLHEYQVRGRAL